MSNQKLNRKPFALALLLTLGFGVLWAMITGWCGAVVQSITQQPRGHENIQVLMDGTPIRMKYSYGQWQKQQF